jgi:hypothetical protein
LVTNATESNEERSPDAVTEKVVWWARRWPGGALGAGGDAGGTSVGWHWG